MNEVSIQIKELHVIIDPQKNHLQDEASGLMASALIRLHCVSFLKVYKDMNYTYKLAHIMDNVSTS
jgi:hypothetical protein